MLARRCLPLVLAVALLLGVTASAQANSGTLANVVATAEQLTFDVHVEWSECRASGFGSAACRWRAMVSFQEAGAECTDFSAGLELWKSSTQSMPGTIDRALAVPMVPGARATLCLWVYAEASGLWTSVARADVVAPDPPEPPPEKWTTAEAKLVALDFAQLVSPAARAISASCTPGTVASCTVSWTDARHQWRGKLALDQQRATFTGGRALRSCLRGKRSGCWQAARRVWDPGQEPPISGG